jgi:hypothetical protein
VLDVEVDAIVSPEVVVPTEREDWEVLPEGKPGLVVDAAPVTREVGHDEPALSDLGDDLGRRVPPESIIEVNLRRLERLARYNLVTRLPDGNWKGSGGR